MPATMSMEAFSDEEVGNDSDQSAKSSDQHQCRGFAKRDPLDMKISMVSIHLIVRK